MLFVATLYFMPLKKLFFQQHSQNSCFLSILVLSHVLLSEDLSPACSLGQKKRTYFVLLNLVKRLTLFIEYRFSYVNAMMPWIIDHLLTPTF